MASFLASLTSTILLRFLSEVMEGGGGVREKGEGWREGEGQKGWKGKEEQEKVRTRIAAHLLQTSKNHLY